jgi:hypothetical protein
VQVDERSCLRGGGHRGEGSVRPASAGTRIGSEKPEHESQRVVYLAKISSREVAPVETSHAPGADGRHRVEEYSFSARGGRRPDESRSSDPGEFHETDTKHIPDEIP